MFVRRKIHRFHRTRLREPRRDGEPRWQLPHTRLTFRGCDQKAFTRAVWLHADDRAILVNHFARRFSREKVVSIDGLVVRPPEDDQAVGTKRRAAEVMVV